ncbi:MULTISPECIES: hypothetical protein [Leuconostoc]|jgi:hypothetical protein|uniref:hypothetical protein n=1 Tax=Leuconostoc TaxID=1243 RepID=UPI000AC98F4A|nr:hypothetical protein [Leuconostoc mesenteroides]MCV2529789.1 hypothetical protein [Leuconostoc mesenteroides]QHM58162.1 hypothetical protein C7M45_00867 [Leuconostoc mesenteroides]USI46707.1 hypothetical protein M0D19_04870 [Leuconostoc mesenteroides]WJM72301.1 hypothetical protein QTN54_05045 [Leuconostoc mesenteroides]WVI89483.1 hypothetical protein VPH57_04815 [Leuconostoc mesenteroides]
MMSEIIIRRKNMIGNTISNIITLVAWGLNLFIILLALITQWGIYSDSFVVVQLLLGLNTRVINGGLQTIMICITLILLPTLRSLLSKREDI